MSEAALADKFEVEIFKPESGTPSGITVFLPGTLLKLHTFESTYNVLLEKNQIVIGFTKMNPFPIVGRSHKKMAEDAANVVKEFRALEGNENLPEKYNVVGHSLGGKVALMLAAKYDIENIKNVIALDPVDEKPTEITNRNPSKRTNLDDSQAESIHLFQSEKGGDGFFAQCPKDTNASVVKEIYPDKITSFKINDDAVHMAYVDGKDGDAGESARATVQAKIREVI